MTALLLAAILAQAPADEVKYIPLGTPLELKLDGELETVRYYRLPEFKTLLEVDLQLQRAEHQLGVYLDIDEKYQGIIEEKDREIGTLKEDVTTYRTRSERMQKNWEEAEQRYIDAAGGPWWPYIVAVAGAVVGIVGVTLYLSEKLREPQPQPAQ